MNDVEDFERTQPVPTGQSVNNPTANEETQPVRIEAVPVRPSAADPAMRVSKPAQETDQEPLPVWLIDFARQAENVPDENENDRTQRINLSDQDFSANHSELSKADIAEPVNHFSEINQFENQNGFWQKEPQTPKDTVPTGQLFSHPIDEMKTLLNEDPSKAADFIRAHLNDPGFLAESTRSLRDYLSLHPDNQVLWTLFEEITNSKPTERE